MERRPVRARLYLWAAIVLFSGFCWQFVPAARAAETDFKIGVVASLTGPFAAPSKDTLDGLRAWIKVHGLPGKKIDLEVLDDETNPVDAANVFRRLASDPAVKLIYMFGNSNSGLAIKSFASEYKVPIVTGGGADTLGFPPNPWDFKVAPSNKDAMTAVVLYAKRKGYKSIAHIYGTDSYGQLDHKNLVAECAENGIKLVASESFAIDDTNFNAQLADIKAAKSRHALQQRRRPRLDPGVQDLQAAGADDAAHGHPGGHHPGVLRRGRRQAGGERSVGAVPA